MEEDSIILWLQGEAWVYYPGNLWASSPDVAPQPHRKAHARGPTQARYRLHL